jgi:hypothetical protein
VGIAGACFEPGRTLSKEVERGIDGAAGALQAAMDALRA